MYLLFAIIAPMLGIYVGLACLIVFGTVFYFILKENADPHGENEDTDIAHQ